MNIKLQIGRQENADYFGVNLGDIIDINFQQYLIGVVASEIGNASLQACKAQAVASRTYAMTRNVSAGKAISDSGNFMAYRAIRADRNKYPRAYEGVESTIGQILTYKDEPIRAVYSANNGGQTTSSEQRWGGSYPYLITQDDPWDAADGRQKKGHGVGMSQRGAIWASEHGVSYKDILKFYYPNTTLVKNYGQEANTMQTLINAKAAQIIALAKSKLGYPYVYAGAGQSCTPANRQKKINKDYPDIVNKCIALKSGTNDCSNCKYQGQQFFDCRGFTYYIFKQCGISISAVGATTQYNTAASWVRRGKTDDMPNVICSVFKYDANTQKMKHTGLHIGNGVIIHCTGVKSGEVIYGAVSDTSWTHFAIPKGLYTEEELESAEPLTLISGLKKGSSGNSVTQLQQKLNTLGFSCTVDGKYGDNTVNAVKAFQKHYNLTVDGAAGAITRTLILSLTQNNISIPAENLNISDSIFEEPTITIMPIINSNKVSLTLDKGIAEILYKALKDVFIGGKS